MLFPAQTAQILLVVALVAVVVLGIVVTLLVSRLRRLRRSYAAATEGAPRGGLFESVEQQGRRTEALRSEVAALTEDVERMRALQGASVSRVGVVRYDAFDDMGGALSFSVAMLDAEGTGLVLSAINGRSETRCYAKAVVRADSDHSLSAEEREALQAALDSDIRDVAVTTRRRRRVS